MKHIRSIVFLIVVVFATSAYLLAADQVRQSSVPKKIFAHYMGCLPLELFPALAYKECFEAARYGSKEYRQAIGGKYFNWPLLPDRWKQDGVEAAALEIRRAMRAGIDGFAVDLSGRELALSTFRDLIHAAEKYNYPFEIAVCLDAPFRHAGMIRYVLDQFSTSPKLARRNGKIVFLGYASHRDTQMLVGEYLQRRTSGTVKEPAGYTSTTVFPGMPRLPRIRIDYPNINNLGQLWDSPEGFAAFGETRRGYEQQLNDGAPFYEQFELSAVLRGQSPLPDSHQARKELIAQLAKDYDSLGNFLIPLNATDEQILEYAGIARKAGAEWGSAICYQYDRPYGGRLHCPLIVENMIRLWDMAEKTGSSILQLTTWNDYPEGTMISPTRETRYVYSALNAHFAARWKTGKAILPTKDAIYAIYHKYAPDDARRSFPYLPSRVPEYRNVIEVVTILTAPGQISMPGREMNYTAPAGFYYQTVPASVGDVVVTLSRNGQTALELHCGEPITDKPFRAEATPCAFSTDFMEFWHEDFGDIPPASLEGYYATRKGSRFPNWFRMVYFGRNGDFANLPDVAGEDDPDGDGLSNEDEFLHGTDPTVPDASTYPKGYVWTPGAGNGGQFSTNPDYDDRRKPVWSYGAFLHSSGKFTAFRESEVGGGAFLHRFLPYNAIAKPWGAVDRGKNQPFCNVRLFWGSDTSPQVELGVADADLTAICFAPPVGGTAKLVLQAETIASPKNATELTLMQTDHRQEKELPIFLEGGNQVVVPLNLTEGVPVYLRLSKGRVTLTKLYFILELPVKARSHL